MTTSQVEEGFLPVGAHRLSAGRFLPEDAPEDLARAVIDLVAGRRG